MRTQAEELANDLEKDPAYFSQTLWQQITSELRRLSAINAELLEALKSAKMPIEMYRAYGWSDRDGVIEKMTAAIAKAQGEQTWKT